MAVNGIVLAAGAGTRLGRPKALVEVAGSLLVERAVTTLRDGGCDEILVVLGAEADRVTAVANLAGADVVVNERWGSGLASSLQAGLGAVAASTADAAVVALVDQPLVTAPAVRRLLDAWERGATIAVATYDGAPRNPVLLGRTHWRGVAEAVQGDTGARTWLAAQDSQCALVPCDDVASPFDVDTADDLRTVAGILS